MNKTQKITDKLAIGLSALCTFHCLVMPVLITALPSLVAANLADEKFHWMLVLLVIPTSVFALTLGCRKHQQFRLLFMGAIGIGLMISALLFGEDLTGLINETSLTVLGSVIIAVAHWLNYRWCRSMQCEPCHSEN